MNIRFFPPLSLKKPPLKTRRKRKWDVKRGWRGKERKLESETKSSLSPREFSWLAGFRYSVFLFSFLKKRRKRLRNCFLSTCDNKSFYSESKPIGGNFFEHFFYHFLNLWKLELYLLRKLEGFPLHLASNN